MFDRFLVYLKILTLFWPIKLNRNTPEQPKPMFFFVRPISYYQMLSAVFEAVHSVIVKTAKPIQCPFWWVIV